MNHAVSAATTRATRLAGYLAAGVGSSMLATSHADAAIVTIDLTNCGSNNQNITGVNAGMTYNQNKRTVLNFVAGGTLELYFRNRDIGIESDDGGSGNLFRFATNNASASPKNFATGSLIDGPNAANWTADAGQSEFRLPSGISPNFGPGSFMGFRFSTNNGVDWNYGYIEILWNFTGTDSTSTFQLLSAAYESTANLGILAGGAAPVPGAGGLMGLMALGGGAFRRRGRAA